MMQLRRSQLSRRTLLHIVSVVGIAIAGTAFAAERPGEATPQFWFVRHAESEINVGSTAHSQPDEGVTYPLTATGVQQASALADALADTPIISIYSSTRLRAIQTSDAIAFRHRLAVNLAPEAVEIELGIPIDAPDGRQLYRDLLRKWVVDRDMNARIAEGENFADAQRRFLPFVRELMNRHVDDRGVVVVMSHGATLSVFLPVLAPNLPSDFALNHPLSNTSIIKTELRDGKLFCIEWAGIAYDAFGAPAPAAQQVRSR
jgi:2,3-bisphosphoglycerate-dependent phosphoglycerate mutase